jgi:hypothetical protein
MALRKKPKRKLCNIGLPVILNFRKNSANPIIARNQIPIGSNAALARNAAKRIATILRLR